MSAPLVRFEGVSKRFGETQAVREVTLEIAEGEFFALLGPSGCGKTTLLRMLAGFERPDDGRLFLAGEDVTNRPPHLRPANMMFQSYALFPHLSVAQNVAFGLKAQGLGRVQTAARVEEMLTLVRLEGLGGRRPDQLSGGQQQRAALARALAPRPKVLLLDEPMAALDRKLRQETQFELMALRERLGATFLIVTHDQDEAMITADRLAVMHEGRIVQAGTPAEVYERPVNRFVAGFLGEVNLFPRDGGWIGVRPERMRLSRAEPQAGERFPGAVRETGYLGDRTIYLVAGPHGEIRAALPSGGEAFRPGEAVWASFPPEAAMRLAE